MKRARAALAFALLVTGACGGDSSKTASAPAENAVTTPSTPAPAAPSGKLRGDAAAGAHTYATYCASCHGAGGKGDGPAAATLPVRPANHTDHVYMGSLSDEHLYKVISQGGASVGKSPLMAPWGGVVNDEGIRDLIAFIRNLSGT